MNRPVEGNDEPVIPKLSERKAVSPSAWKSGVTWTDGEGEVVTPPSNEHIAHWDDILAASGYDPDFYEIVEPVKVTSWDAQTKEGTEKLWSYRAGIRRKSNKSAISYDDLVQEIKRHRPLSPTLPDGDLTFAVIITDWQIGKADGDGLEGTVKRIKDMIEGVDRRIRDLRKCGRELGTLFVCGGGDMIEGCEGHYAQQTFTVQANRREQLRICRRLIRDAIARWSKLFKRAIVSAVPGNHGENRKDGKSYTDTSDNDDVGVFEVVAEVLAENPKAYGHVEFRLPSDEVYVMFELSGVMVGVAHGHITKGGSDAATKIREWWKGQAFGDQAIGRADILFTGHNHHLAVRQYGKKTHIQCPAEDGGSKWWCDLTGDDSPPGTVTCVIGKGAGPSGWADLFVV